MKCWWHISASMSLFFSQVDKWVLVPWVGNPSVISLFLYSGEWCSTSYLHFLLSSHLLHGNRGQEMAFVYFLPCCDTGWIFPAAPYLHWAHQLMKTARCIDSMSTSVGFHGHPSWWIMQIDVWRRCKQQKPPFGMQATAKWRSLLFPFTGCSFWSPVLVLFMHEYKTVAKMQSTSPFVLIFSFPSTTTS